MALNGGLNQRLGLVYTTEYSFNTSDYQSINFSWYEGNNSTSAQVRLALQIGGNWYVTNTTFSNATAVGQLVISPLSRYCRALTSPPLLRNGAR